MILKPLLPAHAKKTYSIIAPRATHWRKATCDEVDCEAQEFGWASAIDETTDLGQRQAQYIRTLSGRRFGEHRNSAGLTIFEFAPGQQCFTAHEVPLGRPELFVVRGGDTRGWTNEGNRVHANGEDWVDDFATHQQKIADAIEKG
ncbi:hypothetical protein [Amycolatopsis sp. WQ 127309]|uniref:hypothetical protein n=1 Tax=Amycolatopsis sp. WQ 127309 TaxID=2932773 RepID=UPI001FF69471|nr:hypothetical protein [Amycolatopsis sp. WQ 127309]UOZ10546.1 hypothetical protein MUY22_20685 [Amycolatopsis sp. WQ 127309]